jgi:hypothetical protein
MDIKNEVKNITYYYIAVEEWSNTHHLLKINRITINSLWSGLGIL